MANGVRRRFVLRDAEREWELAQKMGTHTARVFAIGPLVDPMISYLAFSVLAGMAYVLDVKERTEDGDILIYPEDVADVVGCSASRCGSMLRELHVAGLVAGNAHAGYAFAGPLAEEDE